MNKVVVLCSGGLDSVTLAYHVKNQGGEPILVNVNYGQSMWQMEHASAVRCALRLDCEFHNVVLDMGSLLDGSALTDGRVPVPTGEYTQEVMKTTVVPNRNAILANIAVAAAVFKGAVKVALAVHSGDHHIYADCRPEFVGTLDVLVIRATEGAVHIYTPFLHHSKSWIVKWGAALGVRFEETYSCYQGWETHCGECSTCLERRQAFSTAGVGDPTEYLK